MPLTDTAVKNAKAGLKAVKMYDAGGLLLLVAPTGGKLWRFKYRFGGTEKMLAFGKYPQISLKEARDRREDARKLLANGVDPSETKRHRNPPKRNERRTVSRRWRGSGFPSTARSLPRITATGPWPDLSAIFFLGLVREGSTRSPGWSHGRRQVILAIVRPD